PHLRQNHGRTGNGSVRGRQGKQARLACGPDRGPAQATATGWPLEQREQGVDGKRSDARHGLCTHVAGLLETEVRAPTPCQGWACGTQPVLSSLATGRVDAKWFITITATTVSGIARNMPGMPQSKPQNASEPRITSGLKPTALPSNIGSTIAAEAAWQLSTRSAAATGRHPGSS